MELYLEDGNRTIKIKDIESCSNDSNLLFFFINVRLKKLDIQDLENYLSNRTGKTCIVLDSMFDRIMGI